MSVDIMHAVIVSIFLFVWAMIGQFSIDPRANDHQPPVESSQFFLND